MAAFLQPYSIMRFLKKHTHTQNKSPNSFKLRKLFTAQGDDAFFIKWQRFAQYPDGVNLPSASFWCDGIFLSPD